MRDPNPRNWKVAYFQGVNPKPLFTATDARGTPQPITSRPEAGHHPKDPNGVLVYFGTGKYLEVGDNSVAGVPTQTFYAIWDKNEDTLSTIRRRDLLAQTVLKEVNGRRITSDNPIDWSQHLGWYLDLPTQGERQVTDSVLRNNRIIFTTLIPDPQVCSFGGGGWLMELDALSGSRLSESPFDLDEDHDIDADDLVTVRIDGQELTVAVSGVISTEGILPTPTVLSSGTTELKYSSGSTGGIFTTTENPGPGAIGRQAWRQLQ
ncbi:MAG: hypothetical protein KatS3mg131_2782 [Candidatus Tectimicrobiota bacterium]|nr:MAG: hypothetical protein KatS3mg131_2782 [Candidatus Tectomicrobia bacterium]